MEGRSLITDQSRAHTQAPIIEEPEVTESPEVDETITDDTSEGSDVAFEGKYWFDGDDNCFYYDGATEYRYFTDGDVYEAPYTFTNGIINSDRGEWIATFKPGIKDGKFYLEPTFTDGFGGETMVFEEITKDEFDSMFDITE